VDDYPDADSDALTLTGFLGGRIFFGFAPFDVPAGSAIDAVYLDYYDQTSYSSKTSGRFSQPVKIAGSLKISSSEYDAVDHSAGTQVSARTDRWVVNPATGFPWTAAAVNAIAGFGLTSFYATPDLSVYSVQIRVEYTPPPPPKPIFLERLLRNTVWNKLALYDFEEEEPGALSTIAERTGRFALKIVEDLEYTNYRDFVGETGEKAVVVPFGLNGRNVLRFGSTTATRYVLKPEPPFFELTFGDIVTVCRYALDEFPGDDVLLSDNTDGATLTGDSEETVFLTTAATYELNWSTPSGNQAPMEEFGAVRISDTPGFVFDNISDRLTIGKQPDNTGDLWLGDIAEIMLFSAPLTSTERKQVKFYNQLKWGLLGMSTVNFPDPSITGIDYARYYEVPADYSEVTYTNDYEDGGRSFNQSGTPPKRWEVEFSGLDQDEAEIFDVFHDLVKMVGTFDFTDPDNVTHTGVRVESYDRTHSEHRSWINSVRFTLTQYPD
jgi:hypothetical protein